MSIQEILEEGAEKAAEQLQAALLGVRCAMDIHTEWSEWITFGRLHGIPTKMVGVYRIRHIPTDRVMNFGSGKIKDRIRAHFNIFKDGGKPSKKKHTHVSIKMWRDDPDPYNWEVSYLSTNGSVILGRTTETLLMVKYDTINNGYNVIEDFKLI